MNANKQDAGGVLPCPFCATEECGVIETSHGVWGACGKCGTCGPFTTCKEDALAAWNRRAELCRAAPAGGECQHEWQPDADVMNARYCPKCDVTQTIPRKPKDSAPAGVDGLRQGNWHHPDGGRIVGWVIEPDDMERMKADSFCLPRELAECLENLRNLRRDSAPAGSGEKGWLPDLPKPAYPGYHTGTGKYSDDQMRAYGEECSREAFQLYVDANEARIDAERELALFRKLLPEGEVERLKTTIDRYERGLISTPYTRALVDQHNNRATQYYIEVIRLNRVVARQSAKIKRIAALLRKLQQGADGWRPISEYRRDGYFGGYVLTWKHGFTPVVARYDDSGWWTPDGLHVRDPEMFSRIPDATACEEDGK